MKNNMKKLRLALFSALACLFLQSCNDFLDVDQTCSFGNPTMEDP